MSAKLTKQDKLDLRSLAFLLAYDPLVRSAVGEDADHLAKIIFKAVPLSKWERKGPNAQVLTRYFHWLHEPGLSKIQAARYVVTAEARVAGRKLSRDAVEERAEALSREAFRASKRIAYDDGHYPGIDDHPVLMIANTLVQQDKKTR